MVWTNHHPVTWQHLISLLCMLFTVGGKLSSAAITFGADLNLDEALYGPLTTEEIQSNIVSIYNARMKSESNFKQDPVAMLAEEISKNSMDTSCITGKHGTTSDFVYENRSDFARELKFSPNDYNCGQTFDIGKLLILVKKYSKLKPYTIGAEASELDSLTFNESSLALPPESTEKSKTFNKNVTVLVGKEPNSNITATINLSKGPWWATHQKNDESLQEIKGKIKPVSNISNNENNERKIDKTINEKRLQHPNIISNNRKQENIMPSVLQAPQTPNRLLSAPKFQKFHKQETTQMKPQNFQNLKQSTIYQKNAVPQKIQNFVKQKLVPKLQKNHVHELFLNGAPVLKQGLNSAKLADNLLNNSSNLLPTNKEELQPSQHSVYNQPNLMIKTT